MKRCKKLLCLVLALVMALSLCTVAMADETTLGSAKFVLTGYYYGGLVSDATVTKASETEQPDYYNNFSIKTSSICVGTSVDDATATATDWFGKTLSEGESYYLVVTFGLSDNVAEGVTLPADSTAVDLEKYTLSVLKHKSNGLPENLPAYQLSAEKVVLNQSENTVVSMTAYFKLPMLTEGDYAREIDITKIVEQKGNVAPGKTTFALEIVNYLVESETALGDLTSYITVSDSFDYVPGTSKYTIKVAGPKAVVDEYLKSQGFFVREKAHTDAAWECDTQWWFVRECNWGPDAAYLIACTKVNGCTANDIPVCEYSAENQGTNHAAHERVVTFTNKYTENVVVDEPINRQTVTPAPEAPATKPVASPKTGDMGVALYAAMALLSMSGSAVIIGKKRSK